MAVTLSEGSNNPLAELNMTPLIDVLLVLLVMFIITIPIASHTLTVDLPGDTPVTQPNPIKNTISVTRGGSFVWNGDQISDAQLLGLLRRSAALTPEPTILFAPDAQASYARTAEVVRLANVAQVTNFGFVGNEQHRSFDAQ